MPDTYPPLAFLLFAVVFGAFFARSLMTRRTSLDSTTRAERKSNPTGYWIVQVILLFFVLACLIIWMRLQFRLLPA